MVSAGPNLMRSSVLRVLMTSRCPARSARSTSGCPGVRHKPHKGREVIVSSQIRFTNGRQPVDVKWWLLREDDGFKVFDVNVAGIWLAQEQRDQFTSILNSNNGDFAALLDHLKTKIGQAEKGQVNAAMSDGKNNAN